MSNYRVFVLIVQKIRKELYPIRMQLMGHKWVKEGDFYMPEIKSAKTSDSYLMQLWHGEQLLWSSNAYTTYSDNNQLVFKTDLNNPSPLLPLNETLRFVILEGDGKYDKKQESYEKHIQQGGTRVRLPLAVDFADGRLFGELLRRELSVFKNKPCAYYTHFSGTVCGSVQFQSLFMIPYK